MKERLKKMWSCDKLMFGNLETIVGIGCGIIVGLFMWKQLQDSSKNDSELGKSNRRFTEEDLFIFNGEDKRLCYVAIGTEVFDVSSEKSKFIQQGGKRLPEDSWPNNDEKAFRLKFRKVGDLLVMQNFTKETLSQYNGTNGNPVYLCAKGVVYEVDADFYGPEGPYGAMAGKDASRALALMSLESADIESSKLDDLNPSQLSVLDEWVARFEMKYHRVGFLKGESEQQKRKNFLKRERQMVKLHERIDISHDTALFRFELPDSTSVLGLPIGNHIKCWCPNPEPVVPGEWNGVADSESGKKEVERKYTPTTLDDETPGFFELAIKVYKKGVVERFPDGGKMSQHFNNLQIGDMLEIAGPFGLIEFKGKGTFRIKRKERHVKYVGMLAGGTGITPMLQIVKAVLSDPDDSTKLSLLFANQTEKDILVREMLEEQAQKHPTRFKLHYTVDKAPPNWQYSEGFIDSKMISRYMPPPGPDTVIFMCGPPPMIKFACKPNLTELGYEASSQVEF